MDKEQIKLEAKNRLPEYLEIVTSKIGSKYICPICKSGTGQNKTPAGQLNADQTYHCYSCNFHGDIFELVGKIENIIDYPGKFNRVCEIFNLFTAQPKSEQKAHNYADYTDYFKICHERASETNYFSFRGLSKETVDKFMLGFDPAWRSPKALRDGKNPPASPRIIIPTSSHSYLARAVDPNADPKYKAVKEGASELFNKSALSGETPVFIVEGEIDALSVIEAGGQAVALGSTANKNKFIDFIGKNKPEFLLILSLDNDDTGKKTQSEIANALKALKFAFLEANISGRYKDPNEHLTSDSGAFRSVIRDTLAYTSQYAAESAEIKSAELTAKRKKYIDTTSVTAKVDDFIGQIKSSVDTPAIPTGFTELDKLLDEGLYEGLYVLGAISSLGKTSFALQIADQIAQQEQDVLIFSLEMAKTELMAKSISRITLLECRGNINHAKTTRGITAGKRYAGYSSEEKTLISNSIKKYTDYTDHLFIYEGVGDIGASQVREIAETHIKSTGNKPVIIIDYLQILAPHEPRASDKQNTDRAVFELKRLSRDFKIPIIAISSLNRENYSTAINMAAFKESGAVEYSSDVLLGLQLMGAGKKEFNADAEKKKSPRKIELKILKNRNGVTGESVYYDYFPKFNFFKETGKKVIEGCTSALSKEQGEHR